MSQSPSSEHISQNLLGITDPDVLDSALNDFASYEWARLSLEPFPQDLGFAYLRAIHTRMFHQIFAYAGKIRETDVQAQGTGIAYCRPQFIENNIKTLFTKLEREDYLTGLTAKEFSLKLAQRWGELSAIHPFLDGNTRSQSAYISRIAQRADHPIEWRNIDVPTLRSSRLIAITGNEEPLAKHIYSNIVQSHD